MIKHGKILCQVRCLTSAELGTDWYDMKVGRGNILVEDPRQYDLRPGVPGLDPNFERYGVTVFHSLHCLAMLRHALHALQDGKESHRAPPPHLDHCLDYIRESLMCSGDTTIEWPNTIFQDGTRFHGDVTGAEVPHTCRDWQAIREFAIERRSSNDTGHFNPGD